MVGQAAKGLRTHDVAVAALHQLDHFGGQQPAFAHFCAQRDNPLGLFHQLLEGARRIEPGVRLCLEHDAFHAVQPVEELVGAYLYSQLAAVKHMILAHVESAVLHKAHQTGEVHLAVLTFQEFLQVIVAQRAVLDVNLAHNTHLDLGHPGDRDSGKFLCDEREGVLHFPGSKAFSGQQGTAQTGDPAVHHAVSSTLFVLVGGHLIAQRTQHIAVEDAGDALACQREGHLEAAVLFQTGKVQACHRDLRVTGLDQRLAQQMDVVGGTAAAAGLGDQQGSVLQIILAAVQRIQKLADDQQRRVAGIVVDILQPQLCHGTAAVAQQLTLIAFAAQCVLHKPELGNGHVGDEDGVGLFHLRGKFGIMIFHRFLLCCSKQDSPRKSFPRRGKPFSLSFILTFLRRPRPARPARQTGCADGCSRHRGL